MLYRQSTPSFSNKAHPDSTPDPTLQRIHQLPTEILESFTPQQRDAVYHLLAANLPKSQPSPKIIDLRFVVDLLVSRFYVVVLVGKDRRGNVRRHIPDSVARVGNLMMAVLLLLGLNVFISIGVFLILYLLKSGIGIDIFPAHLSDQIQNVI